MAKSLQHHLTDSTHVCKPVLTDVNTFATRWIYLYILYFCTTL